MSKLTTPRSTPAVKLRIKCSQLRNFNANNPPAMVETEVASDSKTALICPVKEEIELCSPAIPSSQIENHSSPLRFATPAMNYPH
jgi:hypothetical protein